MRSGYALPRAAPYGCSGSAAGRPTHHVPSSARSGRSASIALAVAGPKCADVGSAIALFTRSASERTPTDPGRRKPRRGGGRMTPLSPVGTARMFRCTRPTSGSTIAGSASPPVGAGATVAYLARTNSSWSRATFKPRNMIWRLTPSTLASGLALRPSLVMRRRAFEAHVKVRFGTAARSAQCYASGNLPNDTVVLFRAGGQRDAAFCGDDCCSNDRFAAGRKCIQIGGGGPV
jgi:hypothetical protein